MQPAARGKGLTLIEILISVAILASAATLILQALARGAYALALAKNRLRAYTFTSAKMADLELGFKQGLPLDPEGQFRIGQDRFQWRVDTVPAPDDPALEQVTLTVGWHQGRQAYESSYSLVQRTPEKPKT